MAADPSEGQRDYDAAVAIHGTLDVDFATFARAIEALSATAPVAFPTDLHLALGCAQGTPAAIAEFRRQCLPGIDAAIRGICSDEDFVDEARQRALSRLLVATENRAARIGSYAGRGPLRAWARVAATRTALGLRDEIGRGSPVSASVSLILDAPSGDPEHELLKQKYGQELQAGMLLGLQSLPARDRTVLRLYAFEGLNIEAIGALYGVHRATVARWIASARAAILAGAQAHFVHALGVSDDSFQSLRRVLVSQLDLRLSQLGDP